MNDRDLTVSEIVDGLIREGYDPRGGRVVRAAHAIVQGRDTDAVMAILEPELARAARARAWLDRIAEEPKASLGRGTEHLTEARL